MKLTDGEPIMKSNLESLCVFIGFFLILALVYLFVWYECNADDLKKDANREVFDTFVS
jgi:hypothetical protein